MAKYYFGYWAGAVETDWLEKALKAARQLPVGKIDIALNEDGRNGVIIGGCFCVEFEGDRTDENEFKAGAVRMAILNSLRQKGLWQGGFELGAPDPEPSMDKVLADDKLAEIIQSANEKKRKMH